MRVSTASTSIRAPDTLSACEQQTSTHTMSSQHAHFVRSRTIRPSSARTAPIGQALAQRRHALQRDAMRRSAGRAERDSGLQHQAHSSGQPFRNTSVRIPGPSWTA
jgi:hypothetical protein